MTATAKRPMNDMDRAIVKLSAAILNRVSHDGEGGADPNVLLVAVHVHKLELECLREVVFGNAFGAGAKPTRESMNAAFEALFITRCAEEAEVFTPSAILMPRINGAGG